MIILPEDKNKKKKRLKKAKPVVPSKKISADYYARLKDLIATITLPTHNIANIAAQGANAAEIAAAIEIGVEDSQAIFNTEAYDIAKNFTDRSSKYNKEKLEKSLAYVFGVDTTTIVDNKLVGDALKLRTAQNTALIKTISSKHWARVTQAVLDNYTGTSEVTLRDALYDIGGITKRHAKFIARDQTSKLNGSLTQIRHQNIGIDSYKWSNSDDSRVVGNPSGKYPKVKNYQSHGNHWDREGKTYYYSRPPKDGNPTEAYGCRCRAIPIVNPSKIKYVNV